jgi:L-lactate dehydrogenase complex protein LldG
MKNARETILTALAATRPAFPPRERRLVAPAMPDDPVSVLGERLAAAGGRFIRAPRAGWVEAVDWPAARTLYSAHPDLPSRGLEAALPPSDGSSESTAQGATEALAGLDLCVLRGDFAVVENGAVWQVPRDPFERRAALLAEHLVVVIEGDAVVATLHQAYDRIDLEALDFGWFLCGPSKTADIEQALVLGAHGPRSMRLVWLVDAPAAGSTQPM